MNEIERILSEVAAELDWLDPAPVFIGGATIGLFLDAFGRSQLRPTKDIDCIIPTLTTTMEWFSLERELRRRGWQPDPGGPICNAHHLRKALPRETFEGPLSVPDGRRKSPRRLIGGQRFGQAEASPWRRSMPGPRLTVPSISSPIRGRHNAARAQAATACTASVGVPANHG